MLWSITTLSWLTSSDQLWIFTSKQSGDQTTNRVAWVGVYWENNTSFLDIENLTDCSAIKKPLLYMLNDSYRLSWMRDTKTNGRYWGIA